LHHGDSFFKLIDVICRPHRDRYRGPWVQGRRELSLGAGHLVWSLV